MSHFIKRIFLFLVFAMLGYCIILPIWSNLIPFEAFKKNMNYKIGSYGHMYTRLKEAETVTDIDILVLGSSHAYRGFDPRIFEAKGLSIFVLGSSSQTPIQALGLIKEYLPKIKPATVVYEVYPDIFQNDGVESSLDILANHTLNWEDVKMSFKTNQLKTYNVLINDLFRESFGLNKDFKEPLETKEDIYTGKGYVEKVQIENKEGRNINAGSYSLKPDQLQAFGQVVEFLATNGVKLILVQAPITKRLYNSRLNNDEVDSILSSYGEYYNFNKYMNFNDTIDFYDNHHLTQRGVEKFNEVLINKVDLF